LKLATKAGSIGSKIAGCLTLLAVSAAGAGLLAPLCMMYQVPPTDAPIARTRPRTINRISLSLPLPLPAGACAASSLFAMPIIRHYLGIHRSTERQEQVLCQSCQREQDSGHATGPLWEGACPR